jgi:POT family proton-dependent oligopeptide transporter
VTDSTVSAPIDLHDRAFLGHPRGLAYLAFSEAWERFSYYGMQTLLVLYMTKQLLFPGHIEHILGFGGFRSVLEHAYGHPLSVVALSSAIFGLYTGLVYLTPIFGGLVADRWLGRTRTIISGALLMAAGHFLMAFDATFLLALACLVIGVGGFKGNLAGQVGGLYGPEDLRRADAFQIYYLFINGGVITSPLITGTLGEVYGWHYGFAAAGIGMLIAIVIYLSGRRWLPPEPPRAPSPVRGSQARARVRLKPREWRVVLILLALLPVLAIGSVGNQEIFNAYLLWAPQHIDLVFFGHTMPTSWLITLDSILSVTFLAGALAFWRLWSRRFPEPGEVTKMVIGLAISAIGVLALAAASVIATGGARAGIGWVIAFHAINSIGFANVFPVSLALYARAAPRAVTGTIMGVYYLLFFLANNFVGWLGGLLESLSAVDFWLLHAGLIAAAAAVLFVTGKLAGSMLAPHEENAAPETSAAPAGSTG